MITKETFITNFVNHFKKTHKEFFADVSIERCVKEEASEIYNKMNDYFNRELDRIIADGANGTHLKYMSKKCWVGAFMRRPTNAMRFLMSGIAGKKDIMASTNLLKS